MKLYSAWYCPFAQRAWMALEHKAIAYEYIETDPYQKTLRWLEISRNSGSVPVLTLDSGVAITESNRVLEYLEHAYPMQGPLLSQEPSAQAEQKHWIDFIGKYITPYFYRYLKSQSADSEQLRAKKALELGLYEFSQAMDHRGPFFNGANISAVDIALYPFAYRIQLLLKHYKAYQLPATDAVWKRYEDWFTALLKSANFENTLGDKPSYDQRLIDFYMPYSFGGGQKDVAQVA